MKKMVLSTALVFGLSVTFVNAKSQAAQNTASGASSTSTSSAVPHKIPVIIVSCDGPHIGYFKDKQGKQKCVALKNPKTASPTSTSH